MFRNILVIFLLFNSLLTYGKDPTNDFSDLVVYKKGSNINLTKLSTDTVLVDLELFNNLITKSEQNSDLVVEMNKRIAELETSNTSIVLLNREMYEVQERKQKLLQTYIDDLNKYTGYLETKYEKAEKELKFYRGAFTVTVSVSVVSVTAFVALVGIVVYASR